MSDAVRSGDSPRASVGRVTVVIADDACAVREALADIIRSDPGLELVGVASDADGVVALVESCSPDIAVVDVRMPGGGHRAARMICRRSPRTKVVALSAHDDHGTVVDMVGSGAASYLVKGATAGEVLEAIHRAADGGSTLSTAAARRIVGALAEQLNSRERQLAEREGQLATVREVLRPGALKVVCQPLFDLVSRERRGVEALARFDVEPRRRPDEWFDAAWRLGMGIELEIAAVRAAIPLLERLPEEEFLSLNVSPATLRSPHFAAALPSGSLPRLLVEITEHAPVDDYGALAGCLDGLRRGGLRLAIDDAGAGYASLQHILRLSPDVIKLDMSLTRNVHADRRRRALVAALIPFAAEIGATVVAEGIETEQELLTLRAFGAHWGQGYLLGRPGLLPP